MLGGKRGADLDEFITKQVFAIKDLKNRISLLTAAQNRYSDNIMKQAFKLLDGDDTQHKDNQSQVSRESENGRVIIFQRSEIIFDNR